MKNTLIPLIFLLTVCANCQTHQQDYKTIIDEIAQQREQYKQQYINSNTKDAVVNSANKYLVEKISTTLFPFWYGTKWDFNGVSRIPKKGKIACGYFVTAILTDSGFKIPRIKWAQSASEVFIKKLAKNNIKRFSNTPLSDIKTYLKKSGNGLYIVGLDNHVGFIYVKNETMQFIHANYYEPETGVMSQDLDSWNPLKHSKYRVIGKLMSKQMVVNWINSVKY